MTNNTTATATATNRYHVTHSYTTDGTHLGVYARDIRDLTAADWRGIVQHLDATLGNSVTVDAKFSGTKGSLFLYTRDNEPSFPTYEYIIAYGGLESHGSSAFMDVADESVRLAGLSIRCRP